MSGAESGFAIFGLVSQALLVAFFAARRWWPALAGRLGWLAYAVAALGIGLGAWLVATGASWRLWVGPALFGAWAVLGAAVDLWLHVEWRSPIRWSVFAPYVMLYFWSQMFLWWPLWDVSRPAWAVFALLFSANTALNLRGHFGSGG